MRTLARSSISTAPSIISISPNLFIASPTLTQFHLNRNSHRISIRKWSNRLLKSTGSVAIFCASTAEEFHGWDDPMLDGVLNRTGESNLLIDFMVSIGIDNKKYVYVFVLGLICALAVSRIRLASIVVLPAAVVVFALGFSFGFVRSVSDVDGNLSGGLKETIKVRVSDGVMERLGSVMRFFDELDVRIGRLRSEVGRGVVNRSVGIGELERIGVELDGVRGLAAPARAAVEAYVGELSRENDDGVDLEAEESSKEGKEGEESGYEFLKSVGGFFGGKRSDSRSDEVKDSKQDGTENDPDQGIQGNTAVDLIKGMDINVPGIGRKFSDLLLKKEQDMNGMENSVRRNGIVSEGRDSLNMGGRFKKFDAREEGYSYFSNNVNYTDNRKISFKMRQHNKMETWITEDSVVDSGNVDFRVKHTKREGSFAEERVINKSVKSFGASQMFENDVEDIDVLGATNQRMPLTGDNLAHSAETSSSAFSDDVLFDRYLTEANDLLRQARDYLKEQSEDLAEEMLCQSSELLIIALDMKPMSLLAVGLLGNTYLLHGELKLKKSRKLRALLRQSKFSRRNLQGGAPDLLDDGVVSKEKLARLLVTVCEECEDLLVEAGRKYRMALSIDGNDVRALYNWGLALSFRAELIADIGPEAAPDADKVFMAAIDKFDAMMSKGNVYAPDALYRWGAALQQRSRLRPRTRKEKVKLLQQAKQLYEDALDMDSNNSQVKEALLICSSELDY